MDGDIVGKRQQFDGDVPVSDAEFARQDDSRREVDDTGRIGIRHRGETGELRFTCGAPNAFVRRSDEQYTMASALDERTYCDSQVRR